MLQQTRVDVVIDYYQRWLTVFPDAKRLAQARPARVLKLWEGLGYYARARNLHRASQLIRKRGFPAGFDELLEFPGVGRYTAAAIASIAFDERVAVVDGNVARVLARVLCIADNVRLPRTQLRVFEIAMQLMPATRPGEFNQAMMELGALICTPMNPACDRCPLHAVCGARAAGRIGQLPNRGATQIMRPVNIQAALVRRADRVLVVQRPPDGLLASLWELPVFDPQRFTAGRELFRIRHSITNKRITFRVIGCEPRGGEGTLAARHRWIDRHDLGRLAFPAAQRLALAKIFSAQHQDG